MLKKIFAGLTLSLALALPLSAMAEEALNPSAGYQLRRYDKVEVRVVDSLSQVELNKGDYKANVDGYFNYWNIGLVDVKGKTISQLEAELTERLRAYVKRPEVRVLLTEYGPYRVYVYGKVEKQGQFDLYERHTLLDAISKAGGFTRRAAKRNVVVVHENAEEPYAVVNMQKLLRGEAGAQNPELQDGDRIYIKSNKRL